PVGPQAVDVHHDRRRRGHVRWIGLRTADELVDDVARGDGPGVDDAIVAPASAGGCDQGSEQGTHVLAGAQASEGPARNDRKYSPGTGWPLYHRTCFLTPPGTVRCALREHLIRLRLRKIVRASTTSNHTVETGSAHGTTASRLSAVSFASQLPRYRRSPFTASAPAPSRSITPRSGRKARVTCTP